MNSISNNDEHNYDNDDYTENNDGNRNGDVNMSYLQMPMSMICFTKSSFGRNFSRLKIRLLPSLSSPPRRPSFSPPRLKGRAEDLPSRLCWDQAKPSGIDDKYLPEEEAWTDDLEEGLG